MNLSVAEYEESLENEDAPIGEIQGVSIEESPENPPENEETREKNFVLQNGELNWRDTMRYYRINSDSIIARRMAIREKEGQKRYFCEIFDPKPAFLAAKTTTTFP